MENFGHLARLPFTQAATLRSRENLITMSTAAYKLPINHNNMKIRLTLDTPSNSCLQLLGVAVEARETKPVSTATSPCVVLSVALQCIVETLRTTPPSERGFGGGNFTKVPKTQIIYSYQ